MKKKTINKKIEPEKIARATRDAVLRAADRLEQLAQSARKLAVTAGKRWEESKPAREKAEKELLKAARQAVAFGTEVQKGLKAGLTEVRKRRKSI